MMTALYAFAAMTQPANSTHWFGPATATFPVQFAGNPYDPSENDVQVRFTSSNGHIEDRLAFFNDALGSWQAILVSDVAGSFKASLIRNGKSVPGTPKEGTLKVNHALAHGFVHPDPRHFNRFIWDDGTEETPIGFDLGWQDSSILPIPEQIAKMGKSGIDWTRIWACSWDGKNPWWPQNNVKIPDDTLWPVALAKWEQIEDAAEQSHVGIQFVLFHHGEFSSTVDANWPDNPWNVKNGGFLKKPGDFFTDPEAKKRAKIWLRYAVARYGASPSLFGWELFNEVQWVDPIHLEHRWTEVDAWHKEMADYVRSIDPYHHPVTSSSEQESGFDSSLDYVQPHTYPNNLVSSIMGFTMPTDKPGFFGEFGPSNMAKANIKLAVRDGLLSGLLANDAGAGMFWYWEQVEKGNLYTEFAIGRKVADLSSWSKHPSAKVVDVRTSTSSRSTFIFQPGEGWGPSTQTIFELPSGATPSALGHVSSYFQGKAHQELMAGPLELKFEVPKVSSLTVTLGPSSDNGGDLTIEVDGTQVFNHSFMKGDRPQPISLPLAAGAHDVKMMNQGADWITLTQVAIENLAPGARAVALGEQNWMLARVTRVDGGVGSLDVGLSGVSLVDGVYAVKTIDLNTGQVGSTAVQVKDSVATVRMESPDEMLIFNKR